MGFTHGLLLRQGRVVVSGRLPDVLTDEHLTATFGMPISVVHEEGRSFAHRQRSSSSHAGNGACPRVGDQRL